MMKSRKAEDMLNALGTVLEEQRLGPYDIVICGAMALLLQGMVDRPTRDIDGLGLVVDEGGSLELKKPLLDKEFYKAVERVGSLFHEGRLWFSTAATTLHDDTRLPKGLVERAQVRHYGSRLTIRLCSRQDMVCLKMWAALRRGEPDTSDLIEMRISEEEAGKGALWCLEQDGEALPEIRKLLEELGHGKLAERLD